MIALISTKRIITWSIPHQENNRIQSAETKFIRTECCTLEKVHWERSRQAIKE